MSADLIEALITFLKADSGVSALVGTRVFGVRLPENEAASMPRQAVVLSASGGVSITAGSYVEHDAQRVDAICYAATDKEAGALLRAVAAAFRRLQRQLTNNVLIHWVGSGGGYASQVDSDGLWPAAFQSFQAFYALEETS